MVSKPLLALALGLALLGCPKRPEPAPTAIATTTPGVAGVAAAYANHMNAVFDIIETNKSEPGKAALRVVEYADSNREKIDKLNVAVESLRGLSAEQPGIRVIFLSHMRPVRARAEALMADQPSLATDEALQSAMARVLPSELAGDGIGLDDAATDPSARRVCRRGLSPCPCANDDRCLPTFTCDKCCAGIGPPGIPGCTYPPRKVPKLCDFDSGEEPCFCAVGGRCMKPSTCTRCCGTLSGDPSEVPSECWQ